MNFYADYVGFLRRDLKRNGLTDIDALPDDEIEMAYFNLLFRSIPRQPRKCFLARDLKMPKQYVKRFNRIRKTAESGGDLNIYLSKKLLDPQYDDMLLNHWGLHHLHLGKPSRSPGFVSGTSELLYARVADDAIYFVQVFDHKSFAEQELLEIIYRNWPDLLTGYELVGIMPSTEIPTAKEIVSLRKAGIVLPIRLSNGKLYSPPHGGFATSGISLQVMNRISRFRESVRRFEKMAREFFSPSGYILSDTRNIHLSIEPRGYFAINHRTGARLKLADRDAPVA